MPEIYVETEKLRRLIGAIVKTSELLNRLSASAEGVVDAPPIYDGQLRSQTLNIAGGDPGIMRSLAGRLEEHAASLGQITAAFELADAVEAGSPDIAAAVRFMIESGYTISSMPWYQDRNAPPPGWELKHWLKLPLDDQELVLQGLFGHFRKFIEGPISHVLGSEQDLWNAFHVYLFMQGVVSEPPTSERWQSAARAAGMELDAYVSALTGVKEEHVAAWLRAAETHNLDQGAAISDIVAMTKAGETIEEHFGFTMEGNWTEDDKDAMVEGVLFLAHGMARVTEAADTAAEVFRSVFEGTEFTLSETGEASIGCGRVGTGFACEPGTEHHMSPQLAVHELGHVFNATISNQLEVGLNPERAALKPYEMLGHDTVVDEEGRHVTGCRGAAGFERTNLGYVLGPGDEPFPQQQHPLTMADGNTPGEDFADMLLNWASNSFDYSEAAHGAGLARFNWMEDRMADWITYATEPFQDAWIGP